MMSERPYQVVALLSDLHLEHNSMLARLFNSKAKEAIDDLKQVCDPDWWVINGDICNHGTPDELAEFKALVPERDHWLVTTGNHEFLTNFDDLRQEWLSTFSVGGNTLYKSEIIGGVHFVLLANEHPSDLAGARCWITDEQLLWFTNVLQTHSQKDTVVFMHQPLRNTVTPTRSGQSLCRDQERKLRHILGQNPQIRLWFSGHSHCRLVPDEVWIEGDVTFMGLGATSYMPDPEHGLAEEDPEYSQCRVLEIWPNHLTIRTRDLRVGEWLDKPKPVRCPARYKWVEAPVLAISRNFPVSSLALR